MKFLNLLKKPINTYKMYKTVRAENPTMSRRQALEAVDYKLDPTRVSIYEDAMYGVDKVGFKGYTEEEVKQIQSTPEGREKLNEAYKKQQEMLSKMKKGVAAAAVVATQPPAVKEANKPYEDASSSSFKTKKNVYDSIPSTKSYGVGSRATNPETFKNGVVNMARTMDASANQISKLLKMDAKLLEELYYDKPFLFDLYFEYSLYDDFGASHEDSGINKLIESYEYKYGVTL